MEEGLYQTLVKIISEHEAPLTVSECFDDPRVKPFDVTSTRVSDYLGNLYRRGILERVTPHMSAAPGPAHYFSLLSLPACAQVS